MILLFIIDIKLIKWLSCGCFLEFYPNEYIENNFRLRFMFIFGFNCDAPEVNNLSAIFLF